MDIRSFTANKIKEYRKLRGLTQKELGDRIGVKHNTISGYENCISEPEQDLLFKIAEVLNVSINDLFPDTTQKTISTLTPKNERDIQKRLNDILSDLESDAALSFYNGDEPLDEETKDLLKASLENSITVAKLKAKKKFTTKKNQRQE